MAVAAELRHDGFSDADVRASSGLPDWTRAHVLTHVARNADAMARPREASINDIAIAEKDRRFHWAVPGPRPADVPGLGESPF